ncbi:MAG: hypothetical protein PHI19_00165 [Clostridia bacterium]|nr:hypothetical protein [Clostridia bacterium]
MLTPLMIEDFFDYVENKRRNVTSYVPTVSLRNSDFPLNLLLSSRDTDVKSLMLRDYMRGVSQPVMAQRLGITFNQSYIFDLRRRYARRVALYFTWKLVYEALGEVFDMRLESVFPVDEEAYDNYVVRCAKTGLLSVRDLIDFYAHNKYSVIDKHLGANRATHSRMFDVLRRVCSAHVGVMDN